MGKSICKKALGILCSGFLLASGTFTLHDFSASALDNGIYTATCTPYYVHPVTGVVEDSGGIESEGIGQPMTDSATCTTALIEVDPDGNTYATVRLSLMDNIENVSFMVQEDGNSPFYDVGYDIMQENLDNNTTDFRMQVPSENCYLRATFYVFPMGRDVVYYIGFSNFQSGSADFITSVTIAEPQQEETPQVEESQSDAEQPAATEAAVTTAAAATTTAAATTMTTTVATTSATETQTQTTTGTLAPDAEGYMANTGDDSEAEGLGVQIYDENGNVMQLSDLVEGSAETTEKDSGSNGVVIGILAGCGGILVILGIVYGVIRAKRKKGSQ